MISAVRCGANMQGNAQQARRALSAEQTRRLIKTPANQMTLARKGHFIIFIRHSHFFHNVGFKYFHTVKENTYLWWWYKLKSMSDSACKKRWKGKEICDVFRENLLVWRLEDLTEKNVWRTCKSLPSSKCKTSSIVSDWMKAANKRQKKDS